MRGKGSAVLLILALAGCSSAPEVERTDASKGPPPASAAAPPPISRPAATRDSCGAAPLQSLVGHPRSEIPIPLQPDSQRVACTTCPLSQEVRPDRLNFLFDADSGIIRQIRCG